MRFPDANKFHRAKFRARKRGIKIDKTSVKWWEAVIEEYEKMGGVVADKAYLDELRPKKTTKKVKKVVKSKTKE